MGYQKFRSSEVLICIRNSGIGSSEVQSSHAESEVQSSHSEVQKSELSKKAPPTSSSTDKCFEQQKMSTPEERKF
jgi:hypothetical protein